MGVLVGVLIALGRLSADSELIAMSALGMGRRRLLVPVGILAVGATAITFAHDALARSPFRATLPDARRPLARRAGFLSGRAARLRRTFPRMVLYVNDIDSAATRWKGSSWPAPTEDVSRLTWRRKRL